MIILRQLICVAVRSARALSANTSGLALTEFAFSLPILMLLMTAGVELANYVVVTKRVGDLAVVVADNASRIGTRSEGLSIHQISEAEINDVFIGAALQGGIPDLNENGRVILSSLQRNAEGGQWIAWQRCFGTNGEVSAYGVQGDGATGTSFPGMGPPGNQIQAPPSTAVMVVEVYYNYEPIVPFDPIAVGQIQEFAVFNVRESRELGLPRNPENVPLSTCS
jgi:hypothetical protein